MTTYYNDISKYCCAWLKRLYPDAYVDERSIWDVRPEELAGYEQCHFFAGVGGWSIALQLAGWPKGHPVWTGSCPCQPFSQAGKGEGFADERHLWPAWFHLIEQCRPPVIFGEQVASKDGLAWIDLVQADLEGAGYACGAFDICAAGVGAPHIRQRLWFVGVKIEIDTSQGHHKRHEVIERRRSPRRSDGKESRMANSDIQGRQDIKGRSGSSWSERRSVVDTSCSGYSCRVGNADGDGCETRSEATSSMGQRDSIVTTGWHDCEWIECSDGRFRPVEPGVYPLAYGLSSPSPAIGPYGNAIVPQVAAEFIRAYMEERIMRKPEDKYRDMRSRGRTDDQIRAIALARDDKELERYVKERKEVVKDDMFG